MHYLMTKKVNSKVINNNNNQSQSNKNNQHNSNKTNFFLSNNKSAPNNKLHLKQMKKIKISKIKEYNNTKLIY